MIKLPAFFSESFKKPTGLTGIITGWMMERYNFPIYPAMEKYCDIKEGMKILEIGYGPGEGMKYLLEKYNVKMDGVDFSEQMYKKAKKRNQQAIESGKLNLYIDDFLEMAFSEEKYDLIFFVNVIYFWKDLNAAFTKIKSLLKANGRLVFFMVGPDFLRESPLTSSEHFEHYETETVLNVLRECGFNSVERFNPKNDSENFNIICAG